MSILYDYSNNKQILFPSRELIKIFLVMEQSGLKGSKWSKIYSLHGHARMRLTKNGCIPVPRRFEGQEVSKIGTCGQNYEGRKGIVRFPCKLSRFPEKRKDCGTGLLRTLFVGVMPAFFQNLQPGTGNVTMKALPETQPDIPVFTSPDEENGKLPTFDNFPLYVHMLRD